MGFYPSKNLRVVWLYEDGTMGPTTECETTNYEFTEMKCKAPAFDPHRGEDCSVPGTYTGTGNRGLRHMGKKIEVMAIEDEVINSINSHVHTSHRDVTIIDCEHYPDAFVLNNNKDSDSPFAGYVDFSGVTTRNCENLRIYY